LSAAASALSVNDCTICSISGRKDFSSSALAAICDDPIAAKINALDSLNPVRIAHLLNVNA
jgi:hypothetical protein